METKILDRIKRLLALATSNNEHEAATAANEAQRLMLKHGIETAQLNAPDAPKVADSVTVDTGSMNIWYAHLANHVAKATFCTIFREMGAGAGKSTNQIVICGFPGDIAACSLLLAWLATEINKFCEQQWQLVKTAKISANAWKKSFRLGAVKTVGERLASDREKAKKETASTALVHLSTYENQAQHAISKYFAQAGIHTVKRACAGARNDDGYSRGREAGNLINLSAPKRALGA